jgi:hypothetical protein
MPRLRSNELDSPAITTESSFSPSSRTIEHVPEGWNGFNADVTEEPPKTETLRAWRKPYHPQVVLNSMQFFRRSKFTSSFSLARVARGHRRAVALPGRFRRITEKWLPAVSSWDDWRPTTVRRSRVRVPSS